MTGLITETTLLGEMTTVLSRLVDMESPSTDPQACRRVQEYLGCALGRLGASFEIDEAESPVLLARFGSGQSPILVLGHVDTVWAHGELAERPFTVDGAVARGPGTFDMKAGLVQLLFALRDLVAAGTTPDVTVLVNADEELGSPGSQEVILREAERSRCALVLEGAGPDGEIKTARKGIGMYRLEVLGRAAHAGLDFADGVNAVVELAHQIGRMAGLCDEPAGTTVNVGTAHGGTGRNVVAGQAFAELESRFWSAAEGERVDRALRALRPVDTRASVAVSGGVHREPMERTEGVAWLAALARECAAADGWSLDELAVGGVSDANLTSGAGVPSVDGLGAAGGGAHSVDEHVLLNHMPRRAALLARLISRIEET